MAKGKDQHIVPAGSNWGIRGSNNIRLTAILPNKTQALQVGRQIAINQKSELVIHGRNGRIQDKDSYGRDFFPPEDKKH